MRTMTKAEQYRRAPKPDWESWKQWVDFVLSLDRSASIRMTDLGPVIVFSDGSMHRIERVKK